jgi:hypothetical protein
VVWENDALRQLIGDDTEFTTALEASLGLELARLLDNAQDDLEFALLKRAPKLAEAATPA